MSHKKAKRIRAVLRAKGVAIDTGTQYEKFPNGTLIALRGRRQYQLMKKTV
jgi:hypothetical protein